VATKLATARIRLQGPQYMSYRHLSAYAMGRDTAPRRQAMAKFRLRDNVRRIGQQENRTVVQVRPDPTGETMYWIQLGNNCASRMWARESELEAVAAGNRTPFRPMAEPRERQVRK
jgi:hypothetical protein